MLTRKIVSVARAAAMATVLLAGLAACSTPDAASTPKAAAPTTSADTLSGTITVYGAASLTAAFTKLAAEFEAAHPNVTVQTTFNGSAILVTQILAGAPADIFASADTATMTKLSSLVAGNPVNFATNTLEIAVPVGNPAKIMSFADLAKPGIKTVVCAVAVPCGAATKAIEKSTGVTLTPVSEEMAVTGVLAKVQTGEADAGLVYVTDVAGATGKVTGITFPESSTAVNTYPIAALTGSKNGPVAAAFVSFVTGKVGQAVLRAAGFGKP